jgi:hypothetical protein
VVVDDTNEEAVFEAAMEAGAEDIAPVLDEEGAPTTSYKVRLGWGGWGVQS